MLMYRQDMQTEQADEVSKYADKAKYKLADR